MSRPLKLEPGRNCWRVEQAARAAVVIDAADYFRLARKAILKARSQILVMGWDVDTRIELDQPEADGDGPVTLGALISWVARHRPDLKVHILAWDGQIYNLAGRGTTFLRVAAWKLNRRISYNFDGVHPLGGSHHQKILVVDDALAFCGGIDVTASRWDTREHLDDEPGRRRPTTGRRYHPWHDATMAVDGAAAKALGELSRERWEAACGERLAEPVQASDPWPKELEPDFRDVPVAIARTRGRAGNLGELREIEALFADMIASAERYVYVETQYFASRVIAEAMAKRLAEPLAPEFVVINPETGEGWLDEEVMGPARARLMQSLREHDRHGRFRIYYPVTRGGEGIYVHAKLMIVDDVMLRIGSANMNNRSMGLDTECDLLVDSRLCADPAAAATIASIRTSLMAEHLGVSPETVEQNFRGSLIATIETLRGAGRSLIPLEIREINDVEKKLADSEALDPESADDPFEPISRRKLLSGLRRRRAGAGRS
jgi:phosphatidylserine/phosphatidylglycerophosphate/cardiolipin synthase-like enzyme